VEKEQRDLGGCWEGDLGQLGGEAADRQDVTGRDRSLELSHRRALGSHRTHVRMAARGQEIEDGLLTE
jgi:hypothetical protein